MVSPHRGPVSSPVGLQAILLLVWYSLLNPDRGSIWFLIGLATRTCVDLGFHNEENSPVDQLDSLEADMRRRLFWCTYKMDRLLSISLGRPPSIPDGYINVPVSHVLLDNVPTDGLSYLPAYTMSISTPTNTVQCLANHAPTRLFSCIRSSCDTCNRKSSTRHMAFTDQTGQPIIPRKPGLKIALND